MAVPPCSHAKQPVGDNESRAQCVGLTHCTGIVSGALELHSKIT